MIKLPMFTFLNAPPRSGKSTLAGLLDGQDLSMARCSFADPLRGALLATFYPHELGDVVSIDLRDPATKSLSIPGAGNWTNEQFLIDFSIWLKAKTNEYILGDLAKRCVVDLQDYYTRFLFDDCRTIGDIAPFINSFGASECLLIHIERTGAAFRSGDVGGLLQSLPGVRHIALLNNGKPEDMLRQLAALTGSAIPPAAVAAPTVADL